MRGWGALIAATLLAFLAGIGLGTRLAGRAHQPPRGLGFQRNDAWIAGLYAQIDLRDPLAVFAHVFHHLPDRVVVYPSEGYYYFHFPMRGLEVTGSLTFFPENRDRGLLGFNYVLRRVPAVEGAPFDFDGKYAKLSREDGVVLERLAPLRYAVMFRGRRVAFVLHQDAPEPPSRARLHEDEVYVGPSFDESGLRFHLIFNRKVERLYWLLDEDGFVPESMTPYSTNVAIGLRTGFAFYLDLPRERKILIGVQGYQVMHNTWYDGPFDQMPDNLVQSGDIVVQPYLEAHYRLAPGEIDAFGNYRKIQGSRVPVAPYRVYYDEEELDFVETLEQRGLSGSALFAALTEQVYDYPADYYERLHGTR